MTSFENLYQEKFAANMDDIQGHMNMLKLRIETLAKDYFGPHFYDEVKDYVTSHPFIAGALVLITICSAIPVGIFLSFALLTLIVSLICFLCIEGSVIVIGGLILVGVVSFITVIVVAITAAVGIAFLGTQKIHALFCGHRIHSVPPRASMNNLSTGHTRSAVLQRRLVQAGNPGHSEGNISPDSTENRNSSPEGSENFEIVE